MIVRLASPHGLTLHASTFTRRDVLQGVCQALPAGADVAVNDLERLADRLLGSELICPVTTGPRPGRGAQGLVGEWRHTTRELLATEAAAVAVAIGRRAAGVGVVAPPVLQQVLAAAPSRPDATKAEGGEPADPARLVLSDEQTAMICALATSGDGVQLINAKAGSGKTTVLKIAGQAWQRAGYRVVGAALAARAARQLQHSAGIPADTIAKLLSDLDDPITPGLAENTVLVVDEAGMVGTRQLARLLAHAQHAGAKVVAVGDVAQLPEIQAGGLFRSLVQRLGAIQLQANQRQSQPWEQQALDLLRAGDAIAAIVRYAEHGRVVVGTRAGRLRTRLVQDWWAATQHPGERPPIMLALRRSDVADLNARARALLAQHGRLSPQAITIDQRDFAVGDRIVTLRNARRLGVLNGTFATVTGIDHHQRALLLRTDDGRDLVLPRWYLDSPSPLPHRRRIDHAYAITCHKAQGMTTDRVFVLATDDLYKEWGYVAMSRGQLDNRLYLAIGDHPLADDLDTPLEPKPDAVLAVTAALEQPRGQYLALDQLTATATNASQPPPPQHDGPDRYLAHAGPPHGPTPTRPDSQDLISQRALHRTYTIQLLHAHEQLATHRLGWRQRRLLHRTITHHQQTLADLQHQLGQSTSHAPGISRTHRRPEVSLGMPTIVHSGALERDPPRYLLAELGGWPQTPAAQALWRLAATRIETYRANTGVDDPKDALGRVPDDPQQRARHQSIATLVQETVSTIDALESTRNPGPSDGAAFVELP